MKIIQSFWTGKHKNSNFGFGWSSSKYHYLSWILSCNQLRKFYEKVELFTDEFGYNTLIKKLKLPYTQVHIVLNELDKYDSNLWALSKIKAYSLMKEPFLHVDGDVFIFKSFDEKLMKNPIITQNIETTSEYYWNMWLKIRNELIFIPEIMKKYNHQVHNKAYNMGIFGGTDIDFIKNYTEKSFYFVNKNMNCLSKINAYNFNIFFEQVLLYELAYKNKIDVKCLINENIGDNEYKGFGNFEEIPDERKYLHLLGFYKKQELVCNKMDIYVQKYYPEYYDKLEYLLDLNPKLSSFGFSYKKDEVNSISDKYLKLVINKNTNISNNTMNIYGRNILSEGKVSTFLSYIKTNTNFYLITLTNFKVNEDYSLLEIELLHNEFINIELLSIDYIIFNLINPSITFFDFKTKSKDFLKDDFPKEEIQNFEETLWKRLSIFISYGIFTILEIKKYNNFIGQ